MCRVAGSPQLHPGVRRAVGVLAGCLTLGALLARTTAAAPSDTGWEAGRAALHPRLSVPERPDGDGERVANGRLDFPRALRSLALVQESSTGLRAPGSEGVPPAPDRADMRAGRPRSQEHTSASSRDALAGAPRSSSERSPSQGKEAAQARHSPEALEGTPRPAAAEPTAPAVADDRSPRREVRANAAPGSEGRIALNELGGTRVTYDLRLRDDPATASASRLFGEPAVGASGVRRFQFGVEGLSLGGSGRLQASWLSLTGRDPRQAARRVAFRSEGGRLTLDGLYQESAARLSGDRTLSAEDRALLGDRWGSRVRSLTAGYRLGAGGTLGASLLELGAATGGLTRQRLSWSGRSAHLALDLGRVDARFDRMNALPEADRGDVGARLGSRWRDLSAGLRLASWLSGEGLWSSIRSLVEDRDQRRMRQQWVLTPARGATLTWLRDATTLRTGERAATTVAQTLKLEQRLPSLTLAAALDTTRAEARGGTRRFTLHLAGPTGRPSTGSLDYRCLRDERGRTEENGRLELTTRLRALAALKLEGTRRGSDGQGEERISGEARGALSSRLPWRASLFQLRSDGGIGRRDLTLVIDPPPQAADRPPAPRLSFSLARSEPLAPRAVSADRPAPLPSPTEAVLLMQERPVGRTVLGLGLTGMASGGDRRWGIAYDLRSDPRQPVQLQLSRRLVEAGKVTAPLLQREAVAFRPAAGWQLSLARERLTAACVTGLADGEDRWLVEIGHRTRSLQWSVGGGQQLGPDGRRAGLAGRWRLEGDVAPGAHLRLAYDHFSGLAGPNRLREALTWSYQQRLEPDFSVDLHGAWQCVDGAPEPDLTWRIDLKAAF